MRLPSALVALGCGLVAAADPAAVAQPKATVVKLSQLSAPAPAGWVSEKPKYTLRSYQFKVPGEKGGADGEFIVMPESNPKAVDVFPRWKAQFPVTESAKTAKLELAKGATAELLDVTGTWKFRERPFDPKSKEEERVDYRVVWAVVAEKDEATHVRLSGPREVVAKHYPAFEAWLKGLK